ncbi:MAG TPA: hypothetical protein VJ183_10950 [Chloroflexia bacterium]|nr:hypothetical protein [Chloroflexia bacterium]
MDLQTRVTFNIKRRASLLPNEVAQWLEKANTNVAGLGIHQSQFKALTLMMEELLKRQNEKLALLSPAQPIQAFSQAHRDVVAEILGTNGLWSLFRMIIDQQVSSNFSELLRAADFIASDCYLTCMNRAVEWKLIAEKEHRAPPLVFLHASESPVAANRGRKISALDAEIALGDQVLPIPVIRVPFDHITCYWLLCSIHHEVGHNVNEELMLVEEIKDRLGKELANKGTPADRVLTWKRWAGEILADTFGVLLGGAGFAYTMGLLLLPRSPLSMIFKSGEVHPDSFVRINLLASMLRKCDVPLFTEAADFIMKTWYTPPVITSLIESIKPFVEECDTVADFFLNTQLQALTKDGTAHSLRDFVPDLAGDARKAADLAFFLRTGQNMANIQPGDFPDRLVPVAAQIAYVKLDPAKVDAPDKLHNDALQFQKLIPHPEFAGPETENKDYVGKLARKLDFSALVAEEGEDVGEEEESNQ